MAIITPTPIDPAPLPAPQRGDPDTFSDRVDAFVTWLTIVVSQFYALAVNVYTNGMAVFGLANDSAASAAAAAASASQALTAAVTSVAAVDLVATSSTSVTQGGGVKNFTIQPGKGFRPGMPVRAAITASPGTRMDGYVRTYDSATGAFSMQSEQFQGGGTSSAWTITISGPTYQAGATGGVSFWPGATSDVVLGSTANKMQEISAASGVAIQFIDPASMVAGADAFIINNISDDQYSCDIGIKNEIGATLAFLPAGKITNCNLMDAASPGTWSFSDAVPVGKPLRVTATAASRVAGANGAFIRMVQLDSDRLLFLVHGISLHGIIYQISTNSWGAITQIRGAWAGAGAADNVRAALIDVDKVLVVSCPENTGTAQVCVLTVSGTGFTPGTAQSTAFGASAVRLVDVLIVGTSYVIAYLAASNVLRMQARTVSGTTVSAPGSELVISGSTAAPAIMNITGAGAALGFAAMTATVSTLTITTYTVSGTTLTLGTTATAAVTSISGITIRKTPLDRYLITLINTTTRVAALSFTSTTPVLAVSAAVSSVVAAINSVQAQQLGFTEQVATSGTDSGGGFITEFACVQDTGSGAPVLVGGTFIRSSPAAQTVAPTGTSDDGIASTNTAGWMISTTKDIEVHSFSCSTLVFVAARPYRMGPMNVSAAIPPLSVYPKAQLHNSVLRKFGSLATASLGDGSRAALYSKSLLDVGTMKTSPPLAVDPVNGCKGVDQSSLWLAYSYGTDAVVTIEQVKLV